MHYNKKTAFGFLNIINVIILVQSGTSRAPSPTNSSYNSYIITINSRPFVKLINQKIKGAENDSLVFAFYILHCAFNSALCILHSALINTFLRLRP